MLKISAVFSNSRFLPRFLPRMYKYIGDYIITYFCRVSGAKKRIFAAYKIVTFADDNGGGGTPSDHRPATDCHLAGFFFRKPIQYLIGFFLFETYSVVIEYLEFFGFKSIQ